MDKVRLEVLGLSFSQSTNNAFALLLGEKNGNRRLPIIIGQNEAQAIVIELENMKPPRPLTHDLFISFSKEFGIILKEVFIDKFSEGIFYAKLLFTDGNRVKEIDSRTSDAVALAVRFNCPIFTTKDIMNAASLIIPPENEEKDVDNAEDDLDIEAIEDIFEKAPEGATEYYNLSNDELEKLLQVAINREEYEKASIIRDEMNRRQKK